MHALPRTSRARSPPGVRLHRHKFAEARAAGHAARVRAEHHRAGRSIHELAELTDRSQSAVRRALYQAGVSRRHPGAPRLHD
ncbi:helix-turn-helix domain-containing protein [Terrabacter sp. GCM10012305]|uniref:helix-turn-helix domain-containing protein n=1 Tax=Terrabacter sp. GCM10012305 TaxID=3317348 RepID=UPI003617D885